MAFHGAALFAALGGGNACSKWMVQISQGYVFSETVADVTGAFWSRRRESARAGGRAGWMPCWKSIYMRSRVRRTLDPPGRTEYQSGKESRTVFFRKKLIWRKWKKYCVSVLYPKLSCIGEARLLLATSQAWCWCL